MTRGFRNSLALLLILISCRAEPEKKEKSLLFERNKIERKHGEDCDSLPQTCSTISIEYLEAKGPDQVSEALNTQLRSHIVELISSDGTTPIENLDDLADWYLKEYQAAAKDFSQEPPWEAYINQNLYFKSPHLITVGVNAEIFSGGAHGYRSLSFLNFDPKTGQLYEWHELFTPDFEDVVEKAFREDQNIPMDQAINSTGFWFEGNRFHPPENFGFDANHVILVYNSYEIAPYATGEIRLEIPVSQLEKYLKITL